MENYKHFTIMKLSVASSAIALTALLTSCQSGVKQSEQPTLAFDTLRIDTVCPLTSDSLSPSCHFQLTMEYPVSAVKPELLHTAESFIVNLYFKDDYSDLTPSEAARRYCDNYLQNYLRDTTLVKELYGSDREAAMRWMSYEEISSGRVLYVSDRFLSYAVKFYGYSGGAHGNSSVHNSVIDLTTACPVFLGDLFPEGAMDDVAELLRQQLASDQGCSTPEALADLGFFSPSEIDLTDNFYIDDNGITWQYNPYDIAPYAFGIVSVTLTWDQVYPYLLEESPLIDMAQATDSVAAE
jgi:hypothetical protein